MGTIGGNAGGYGVQSSSAGLVGQGLNAALGIEGNPTMSPGTLANAAMSMAPFGLGLVNTAAGMAATNIQNQQTVAALNEMNQGLNVATAPMPSAALGAPGGPGAEGTGGAIGISGDVGQPTSAAIGEAAAAGVAGVGVPGIGEPGIGGPGGGGGAGGDGTVLCTEFHRRGWMDDAAYAQDCAYGRTLPPEVLRGYHRWAVPLAHAMRSSTRLAWIIHGLCRPWLRAMAGRPTGLSAVYLGIGLPLCAWLGRDRTLPSRPPVLA